MEVRNIWRKLKVSIWWTSVLFFLHLKTDKRNMPKRETSTDFSQYANSSCPWATGTIFSIKIYTTNLDLIDFHSKLRNGRTDEEAK